jgi:hypothetical protein
MPRFSQPLQFHHCNWLHVGSGLYSPDVPRPLLTGPLCPITIYGSPVALPKLQMAPKFTLLIFSGSRKKDPRYACLSEAKASHQQIWVEVSSCAPHFLHNELSISPIKWRSFQGNMSGKETCNNHGLHPTEGQKSSSGIQIGSRD